MPLDARKIAHIEANRALIRDGREETVVFVSGTSPITYRAVSGCVWHDVGKVPPGITERIGFITRQPWDAILQFPEDETFESDLILICRTTTATQAAVAAATDKLYTVLDRIKTGLGVDSSGSQGNRWMVKVRRLKYET